MQQIDKVYLEEMMRRAAQEDHFPAGPV